MLLVSHCVSFQFFCTLISQRSVTVHLRCGSVLANSFIANFLICPTVKELWKLVNIGKVINKSSFFYSLCMHELCIL